MFWKLALTRQYTWLNAGDAGNLLLPWFQMQAGELHRFAFTFWDPYQWCGQPLIGQGQMGTAYPFNWLLWAMPLHHGWLRHVYLNWYFILIHFQAALFAYWLCRDLRRSIAASLFAGLAFTTGPLLGTSEWAPQLNAAVWAPLLLMQFLRIQRAQRPLRSAMLCGAALGMSWLTGSGQIPLLLSILALCLFAWEAYRSKRWVEPIVFTLTTCGTAALQALPTLEYLAYSPASWWKFGANAWREHAAYPMQLPGIVAPQFAPDLFAGWTLLAFAAWGLWATSRKQEEPVKLFAILGLAGLLLSLGHYVVFEGILYGLRGLALEPKSALILFGLSAAVLAAYGIDAGRHLADSAPDAPHRIAQVLALISGISWIILLLFALTGNELLKMTPLALCSIASILVAGLLEAWHRGAITPRAGAVCVILLGMWEFGNIAGATWVNVELGWGWLSQLQNGSDAVKFLAAQPMSVRVDTTGIPYHFGDWYGVEQFDGKTGGTQNVVHAMEFPSARDIAGVNFSVSTKPLPGTEVFNSSLGTKVYENKNAFPRAFVAHQVDGAKNPFEVGYFLSKPSSELRNHAFVTGTPPKISGTCAGPDAVSILWRKGRSVRVKASLSCDGLLVLGQTWYPGWSVNVDGKPSPLYEAYSFLQATPLTTGLHEVTFTYKPRAVWTGAAITFLTLLIVLIVSLRTAAGESGRLHDLSAKPNES